MADTLYKTKAISKGGRNGGKIALEEGGLYLHAEHTKGLGGSGEGTNPEQLFALGWANCFNGAVLFIAGQKKLVASMAVVACEVGLGRGRRGLLAAGRPGDRPAAAQVSAGRRRAAVAPG